MRVLCLLAPRLGIQLVERERPALAGRPVILIRGEGDEAAVTLSAVPAVLAGSSAGQARRAAPQALFLPDNASDCIDELERIAGVLTKLAGPAVEVGGRDHLFLDLQPLLRRFSTEERAAESLSGTLSERVGLSLRAGVASTRAEALACARGARNGPAVSPPSVGSPVEAPMRGLADAPLHASFTIPPGADAAAARLRIRRALRRLGTIAEAGGHGYRRFVISFDNGGTARTYRFRRAVPAFTARDFEDAVATMELEPGDGPVRVRMTWTGVSPEVRPPAWFAGRRRGAEARPRQLLLRATA